MMKIYNSDKDAYQNCTDYITELADKYDVKYHNLNLLKNREEILPDTSMKDHTHTNYTGAMTTSKLYAEIWEIRF